MSIEVPVSNGEHFGVRRIFCVGRNYRAHIAEMGGDQRESPFYFTKPADALVQAGVAVPYPPMTQDFHHEVELVIAIDAAGADIGVEAAYDHVFGFAVGVDLTRRDLQMEARKTGRPWDMGKAFDFSAPCGVIKPIAEAGRMTDAAIAITVNDETRQSSNVSLMIWSVAEVIADLSRYVELRRGDLIFTGTPEGVGALRPGDVVEATLQGVDPLRFEIVARVHGHAAGASR